MRYSKKMWAKVREGNPNQQLWNIGRTIGQMWRELPDDEKSIYQGEYDHEKIDYDKAMKLYHASPQYLKFQEDKAKAKQQEKEQAAADKISNRDSNSMSGHSTPTQNILQSGNTQPLMMMAPPQSAMLPPSHLPPPQHMHQQHHQLQQQPYSSSNAVHRPPPQMPPQQQQRSRQQIPAGTPHEAGVFIQPVDSDDHGDSQLTRRAQHQTRYDRNQRLIAEIFSDVNVHDPRTIVTQQRIDMLRKQANSLVQHQGKLEEELTLLQRRFDTKKRKIQDAGREFEENLKKACNEAPVIDDEKYSKMVDAAAEKLISAHKGQTAQAPNETRATEENIENQTVVAEN